VGLFAETLSWYHETAELRADEFRERALTAG